MSKDNKRFRQISLAESFSYSKKSRNSHSQTSTMEQNLRDLLAAAAEKRITKADKIVDDKIHHNSRTSTQDKTEICEDSEQIFVADSQELFSDSDELFPTTSVDEIPPTPEETLDSSDFCRSADIFTDSSKMQPPLENDTEEEQFNELSFFNRIPDCRLPLPKMEPSENHSIMFSPHIRPGDAPRPYPNTYRDFWGYDHVRMPCSPLSKYPVSDMRGERQIVSRWELICRSLCRTIETSEQLEEAIMEYNSQYRNLWNFNALHAFFNQCLEDHERVHFFETILPVMIEIALDLPNICTQPPPLMKKNKDRYVTMSQKQIGCLLLNAFFCTFPRRNHYPRKEKFEYSSYPDINFNRLYFGVKNKIVPRNAEKLKCLLSYFRRITSQVPSGTVTFHRQSLKNLPEWKYSKKGLKTAIVKSSGLIETEGHGMFQVDFANKFVGGGVLGHGCVQEEIRFIICPELIVSRLLVECLGPTEALIITGVEQYSKYSGYSDDFTWEGNFDDPTLRDSWGRKCTEIVAMDATHFRSTNEQYKSFRIERELNKAFSGFYEDANPENLSAVATGNWGCGAFNGNPLLKFLIQLIAASEAGRDMVYFTFGNRTLKRELQDIYDLVTEKNINVGDMWKLIMNYSNTAKVQPISYKIKPTLTEFISTVLSEEYTEDSIMFKDSSQSSEISNSEQLALVKLIEDVEDSSSTEIEESEDTLVNEPG
ncbi:poly(ADP-ribose) glycohydrolase isoform X2 [Parasteatoda tepidariorum]|uniref:poly(ADP-ribose) glycohydrolase isoform X2 n=1 Tax=Parasteatoda tepidariorum TaxID=114398 RepID=UPI001C72140A|nr:poly(ADP-ribose) glycohydrolase isoform X2 [Parasteatoda tepidariorum]